MGFIKKYIFVLILLIGFLLRFYNLGTNPPSLTWDEVAWGYNAYSIVLSGRDEFGKIPISYMESFGDFKPPLYAYLTAIPVWLFGMNEFSTRFTSALFGSLTVLVTYFLVLEIFFQSKYKKRYALISALLLAISPWHILLSRAAFEANLAQFFIILGIYLFLFSTREKKFSKYIFVSLACFVAAVYTFNTSRVFLPLLIPLLFLIKWKSLIKNLKTFVISVFFAAVLAIPLLLFLLTPQAKLRYEEVNIFSDIKVIERVNQEIKNDNNAPFSKAIHNRRLAYAVEYLSHYFDNLNPIFLFIKGDGNPKFSIQDVGQLYIWELPFLIIGLILLVKKKEGSWGIIPLWLVLGIVPAATARETPHALRIETVLPTFQVIVAYGLVWSFVFINKYKINIFNMNLKYFIYLSIVVTVSFTFMYFLHNYFVHYPKTYASEWQYGYKEAVRYTEENKGKYKKIFFTKDLGRPYIYVLFYGEYPPSYLIENSKIRREALGFVHVDEINKYIFTDNMPEPEVGSLYIVNSGKIPQGVKILKNFYQPNGAKILTAYEK